MKLLLRFIMQKMELKLKLNTNLCSTIAYDTGLYVEWIEKMVFFFKLLPQYVWNMVSKRYSRTKSSYFLFRFTIVLRKHVWRIRYILELWTDLSERMEHKNILFSLKKNKTPKINLALIKNHLIFFLIIYFILLSSDTRSNTYRIHNVQTAHKYPCIHPPLSVSQPSDRSYSRFLFNRNC